MRLYYNTTVTSAEVILREGFRDEENRHPSTDRRFRGVWLIDNPGAIDANAVRNTWLVVDIPSMIIRHYEFPAGVSIDEPQAAQPTGYREFMVPADVVNQYGVHLASDDEPEP